jgi:hypothetical protein
MVKGNRLALIIAAAVVILAAVGVTGALISCAPRFPSPKRSKPNSSHAEWVDGLLSRQQWMKSWRTGLVSSAGAQAMPTWLGLTPVTGR